MVRKASPKSQSQSSATGTALAFGGTVKSLVLPSGSKLMFTEPDQDGIILFLGIKDLTDKVSEALEQGKKVLYFVGHDGKRAVSMAMTYKMQEEKDTFVPNHFYYFHLADLVQTKEPTPMKDFTILDLGVEGQTVPVTSDRLPGIKEINCSLETIKDLNYNKLNYPLRVV